MMKILIILITFNFMYCFSQDHKKTNLNLESIISYDYYTVTIDFKQKINNKLYFQSWNSYNNPINLNRFKYFVNDNYIIYKQNKRFYYGIGYNILYTDNKIWNKSFNIKFNYKIL